MRLCLYQSANKQGSRCRSDVERFPFECETAILLPSQNMHDIPEARVPLLFLQSWVLPPFYRLNRFCSDELVLSLFCDDPIT